jgi:hypothetical protein
MARVENALVTPNLKWKDEHATGWDAVGENTYVNLSGSLAFETSLLPSAETRLSLLQMKVSLTVQ